MFVCENSHLSVFTSIYLLSRHSPSTRIWMPLPQRGSTSRLSNPISFRCKVLGYFSHRDPKRPYKCWSSPATKICTFLKCGDSVERFVPKMMASEMGWPVWGHHGPKRGRPKAVTSSFSYNRYAKMCTNVKEMVIKTKTRQEQSADTWIAKVGYKLKNTLEWQWVPWSGGVISIHGLWS